MGEKAQEKLRAAQARSLDCAEKFGWSDKRTRLALFWSDAWSLAVAKYCPDHPLALFSVK